MRISISNLTVSFGPTVAVAALDLTIESGELVALVGPSGCGKTTTLNFVAGLISGSTGELLFDDRDVTSVSPQGRNLGMVFQDYAIYPHLTVEENIRFPLDIARIPRATALESVYSTAELVGVADLLKRRPHQLSGGQRQRVALARALVKRPGALLLDEPLSNLDAHLRVQTRAEIRRLQSELKITTILVTHDQSEALAIADRVAVMDAGRIAALADPATMYARPPTLNAAKFIGSPQMNLWDLAEAGSGFARGALVDLVGSNVGSSPYIVGLRPEHAVVDAGGAPGEIVLREVLGRDVLLHVRTGDSLVRVMVAAEAADGLYAGQRVHLSSSLANWHAYDRDTGSRIELRPPVAGVST